MDLVAIDTADVVRRMRPARPVTNPRIARVATQANAIGLLHGALGKTDDLGDIAASVHVKAAVAVAILALHSLLLVVCVLEILRSFLVARCAGFAAYARGAGYFDVPGESLLALGAGGGRACGQDAGETAND